jgi:hypothetical protein
MPHTPSATRQPGNPATRQPGNPATRQPGNPATRPRALAAVILSTGTHYDERFEKRPFDVARDAPNKKGGAVAALIDD